MVQLISVPYHLGRRDLGMGRGPAAFHDAGAVDRVAEGSGRPVARLDVEPDQPFDHEVGAGFAVQRSLSRAVHACVADGDRPFVLGGNCSCVLGAVAGLGLGARTGVVWFDAHADANTPETTDSGFLDGMPVSVLVGRSWQRLAAGVPGFVPLPEENVLLVGARDIDPAEQELLDASGIGWVGPDRLADALEPELAGLASRVDAVHVHVDLDVIDLADGRANEYATDRGPALGELVDAVATIGSACAVSSVSLTSYNPEVDTDTRALRSGLRLMDALAALLRMGD